MRRGPRASAAVRRALLARMLTADSPAALDGFLTLASDAPPRAAKRSPSPIP